MSMTIQAVAMELCRRGSADQFTSSEVKLATWLINAAEKQGGFPVELTMREIKEGCTIAGSELAGWGAHYRTIGSALEGLQEHGFIVIGEGRPKGFGHQAKVIMPSPAVLRA